MYIVQNVQEVVDYSISKNEDSLIVDISSSYGMSPAFLINVSTSSGSIIGALFYILQLKLAL